MKRSLLATGVAASTLWLGIAGAQDLERAPRRVRVVAGDGAGVPGVLLSARGDHRSTTTGANGAAEIAGASGRDIEVWRAGDLRVVRHDDSRGEFVASGLPELTVRALQAETGAPVRLASGSLEIPFEVRVPLAADAETGLLRRSAIAVAWQLIDRPLEQVLDVRMQGSGEDWMAVATEQLPSVFSGRVRRIEVVVAVRRRCRIRMRVLDHTGTPVAGAEADGVRWAELGDRLSLPVPHVSQGKSDSTGVIEVDVPWFDQDLVTVSVRCGPPEKIHLEGRSGPIRLKAGQVLGADVQMRSAPGRAAEGRGVGGFVGSGGAREVPPPERPGSVQLRLVDASGRALGRAALVVHDGRDHSVVTDAAGTASVTGLCPGPARVFLVDETLRPAAVTATVVAGETTIVDVVEPMGRDLDVVVTNHDGAPVAAATVSCRIRTREYRPISDGTWRTMLTDLSGRLRVPGAPAGPLSIVVEYGGRVVRTPVASDAPTEVRVTILPATE